MDPVQVGSHKGQAYDGIVTIYFRTQMCFGWYATGLTDFRYCTKRRASISKLDSAVCQGAVVLWLEALVTLRES